MLRVKIIIGYKVDLNLGALDTAEVAICLLSNLKALDTYGLLNSQNVIFVKYLILYFLIKYGMMLLFGQYVPHINY